MGPLNLPPERSEKVRFVVFLGSRTVAVRGEKMCQNMLKTTYRADATYAGMAPGAC